MEPAHLVLKYQTSASDGNGVSTDYIDLAKDLSMVNRRLYRQGRNYAVSHIEFVGNFPTVDTVLCNPQVAGNTWVVQNAWKKAFANWMQQQKEGADAAGGQNFRPKWEDFKVYLDDHARDYNNGNSLAVLDGDGNAVNTGEWVYSRLLYTQDDGTTGIPATFEPFLHLIGPDVSTTDYGLVEAYEESRAQVQAEPHTSSDASESLYSLMHSQDDSMDELIDRIESDNDKAPYDMDEYTGGATNADSAWDTSQGASTIGNPIASTGPFVAQCGLIKLDMAHYLAGAGVVGQQAIIFVHCVPGGYKGCLSDPMGQ